MTATPSSSSQHAGRAWVFGDDLTSEVLAPGRYMKFSIEEIAKHCLESVEPRFAAEVRPGDVVVGGRNFGAGSSREHVPQAMAASGICFLVGKSFARIFYRNCINLGLPAVVAPDAVDAASPGSTLRLDLDGAVVEVDGVSFPIVPVPEFMREMFAAGGLVPWVASRLASA